MYSFALGQAQIMGIVNVTPDSFSDGGCYATLEAAIAHGQELQAQGANILDIGGQSTRPGHVPVPPKEELRRVLPVLAEPWQVPVSIDTYEPEVARAALAAGAQIINDVSGWVNPAMAAVVREAGAGWVLMHNAGGADAAPSYAGGVVAVVAQALRRMVAQAEALGLQRAQLCVDPGIGFGKTRADDLALLQATAALRVPGLCYLVGASRKRVVQHYAGRHLQPHELDAWTHKLHAIAWAAGAEILRVHDVRGARQTSTQFARQSGQNGNQSKK